MLSIVGRAHEGRPIFATDEDRGFFVDRLRRVFVPGAAQLLAWALMVTRRRRGRRCAKQWPTAWRGGSGLDAVVVHHRGVRTVG